MFESFLKVPLVQIESADVKIRVRTSVYIRVLDEPMYVVVYRLRRNVVIKS